MGEKPVFAGVNLANFRGDFGIGQGSISETGFARCQLRHSVAITAPIGLVSDFPKGPPHFVALESRRPASAKASLGPPLVGLALPRSRADRVTLRMQPVHAGLAGNHA